MARKKLTVSEPYDFTLLVGHLHPSKQSIVVLEPYDFTLLVG